MPIPDRDNAPNTSGETFPIRTVASLTGIKPITLRAWERRYGLIQPVRTASGHRLYTREHIDLIRQILTLLDKGMSIGQVSDALRQATGENSPWQRWLARMVEAIAHFDEGGLEEIYNEALSLHAFEQVNRQLLLPLLVELGRRWESREGSVAEEHFFGVYLRNKLGAQFHHRTRLTAGPKLLCACPEGEHHEVGLLLFALAAEHAGLRCVLLGANMPLAELPLAARRAGCDAIVLSSAIDPPAEVLEAQLPALVRAAHCAVFVGGGTATRHKAAITAAGAHAIGSDIPLGVRRIADTLMQEKTR